MVFEALRERAIFLEIAPHLTRKLPIMTPCYSWWEVPYYWTGMKIYDILSFGRVLGSSRYSSASESSIQFPVINQQDLKGSIVYYDGQMDDSRMNVSLALTSAIYGAKIANHVEVIDLIHEKAENGVEKISGVLVKDNLTGEQWEIRSKLVVNATGPFVDSVRKMGTKDCTNMITPSSGAHIILPDYFAPTEMGMIIPKTKDGRVIFLIPWQGKVVAGTTDTPCEITNSPKPSEAEIQFILESISDYVSVDVRKQDILASWSGIRPLASDPNASNTESLVRDHIIEFGPTQLLTITGGKWTTYRKMASDVVDFAISHIDYQKPLKPVSTQNQLLIGSSGWTKELFIDLMQKYSRVKNTLGNSNVAPMNSDIARHLSLSYGVQSFKVAKIASEGYGKRLAHSYPYIEAEVVYAVQNEYACTAVDVLARRLRLAFLDSNASNQALPKTIEIMADLLNWDEDRKMKEKEDALNFLKNMK